MAMVMAACSSSCSSCGRSSAVIGLMRLGIHAGWMSKGGIGFGSNSFLRRAGESEQCKNMAVIIRAAGDGEKDTSRPKTLSSSKRPKTMSSVVDRPAILNRKRVTPKGGAERRNIIQSLVDDIAGFMAPREKGDIRDVVLMSLSFAVLIYISQHLVHAFVALRHTFQPFHHF